MLIDRMAAVHATAEELAATHGVRTLALEGDVTDYAPDEGVRRRGEDGAGAASTTSSSPSAIGSGKFGFPFWDLSPADWPRVLEVNVVGGGERGPRLRAGCWSRRGRGRCCSSRASPGRSARRPTRRTARARRRIINFAQCAAKDLAPYGVRVNTLCPGMVQTALNRSVWEAWADKQPPETWQSYEDWAGEKVRRVVPLGRWQTPEDIAAMAVFLASARAANVTGQTINVDGGFVMHW